MSPSPAPSAHAATKAALCLGALGVVFGDIGTSPLYTMNECIRHLPEGSRIDGLMGIVCLIFWSLVLVVSVKYLGFITRADNHGEGGIFALLALIHARPAADPKKRPARRGLGVAVVVILAGAALLFGDGIITPAISVLGAAEGLEAIQPHLAHYVPWIACLILAALFWVQHRGTMEIGSVFGPIMLAWFAALGILGACYVWQQPYVLRALNPVWGLKLLAHSPAEVTALLGSVVLAITGAEALYADMGHFGRRAIALSWYGVAFPGLVLNYFGQVAFLYTRPHAQGNPFFAMAPPGLLRGSLTGLSIVAAVIASQALISGAYSLTRQAIQLGYFPRLKINHTSAGHAGQIYVPLVNTLLAAGCIATVILFRSTDRLASAYGIAVTGTMAITSGAFYVVARRNWNWPVVVAGPICALFLVIDLSFFAANARKLADGGWYPLVIAGAILAVMHTWKTGRTIVFERVYGGNLTEDELVTIARSQYVTRVSGAAVFMVGSPRGTPLALLHHVKANRCLHQTVVLLSIVVEDRPAVTEEPRRMKLRAIGEGIWRATGHYGYMESPDVSDLIARVRAAGLTINPQSATYFFSREMVMSGGRTGMWEWEKGLYSFLIRNAQPAKDYYNITPSQIIEIGLPVQL